MLIANVQWLGVFVTCLSLVSMCQLLFTFFLSVILSDVITLVGCHYSTGVGLIAGFITFPTSIRMKTSHFSPNMSKIYGYTFCFQRLAMIVCGTLHLSATLVAIIMVVLILKHRSNIGNDFVKLMKSYHEKLFSKVLVDNVQFALQCCGATSSRDWYPNRDNDYFQDTFDDAFSIPFSCCSKYSNEGCDPYDPSSSTINHQGCITELEKKAILLLWIEISLSGSCLIIEMAVFFSLKRPSEQDDLHSSSSTLKTIYVRSKWGDFSNTTDKYKHDDGTDTNSTAQLCPSLHSEVYLSYKKSRENKRIMWNK
ncbi:CD151 antigen-like [Agrilus planipennis]|uniref:CD151 antigen-like n=1 Tax=Agrilus planipennis TaxID=224129 RepID=A0A1W4XUE3_AGRPL|nr:CD151 antigen-like [Agrilus planipennis]